MLDKLRLVRYLRLAKQSLLVRKLDSTSLRRGQKKKKKKKRKKKKKKKN